MIALIFPIAPRRCLEHRHRCNLCATHTIFFVLLISLLIPAKVWAQYGDGSGKENNLFVISTVAPASFRQTQNVPPVSLPMHDLLEDQDAYYANGVIQTTTLVEGNNWFSSHVEITMDDLKGALVEALPGSAIIITSQSSGSATYNGTRWRGNLSTMDVAQMYKISVEADCDITLTGTPVNPAEHPVAISNGSNWIAFPLSEPMTLSDAFAGFAVSGDMVTGQSGTATYNGTRWRGVISTLEPGQGYVYTSGVAGIRTLTFPASVK